MNDLQLTENIESLGWQFVKNDKNLSITGITPCKIYTGKFHKNIYCLTIHNDNTVKIDVVYELVDSTGKFVEYEFVSMFVGSCTDVESLAHIVKEIIVPKKKIKGRRKKDTDLMPKRNDKRTLCNFK